MNANIHPLLPKAGPSQDGAEGEQQVDAENSQNL